MSTVPLKPTRLEEIRDHVYLKHDLNLFNFVIEINERLRSRNLELAPVEELDFSCITDGPLPIEPMPDRWTNFIDLQTAVELYTPVYQLLLTDNDFWRASNSLQLDETIGLYVAKLLGTPWTPALINNKHPMVPLSTLRAGFRLVLHGLATETQHAILVRCKRERQLCPALRRSARGSSWSGLLRTPLLGSCIEQSVLDQTRSHGALLVGENRHRCAHRLEAELAIEPFLARIRVEDDFLVAGRQRLEPLDDLLAEAAALMVGMHRHVTYI
jgi:hypothetical protein